MRREFDRLIRDYGEYIKYIRKTDIPCFECHDKDMNYCKHCYGTGKKVEVEDLKVRSEAQSVPQSWPRMIEEKPIGNWQQPVYIFYFKHDEPPKLTDLIIKDNRLYEIEFVDALKGRRGRVEYYRAGGQNKPTKEHLIK